MHDHQGRNRLIRRFGAATPFVVPSYSSRGFPEVSEIVDVTRTSLFGSCLVSAFDISIAGASDLGALADVVVLDSGLYETRAYLAASDEHGVPPSHAQWDRQAYRAVLATINAESSNVLAVSFDEYAPIDVQLQLALDDFNSVPRTGRTFLAKPATPGEPIDLGALAAALGGFDDLDVLGVTERELGRSPLERCRALLALRSSLGDQLPIHVFGTITPGAMLAYYFCGADIFDGLNWLRYAYTPGGLSPISEAALLRDEWDAHDDFVRLRVWEGNLRYLRYFQSWLRELGGGTAVDAAHPGRPSDAIVTAAMALARRAGGAHGR